MRNNHHYSFSIFLDPNIFYIGTQRSQVLIYDIRQTNLNEHKGVVEFPIQERRPIVSVCHIPSSDNHRFPCAGLFVMTLGSLW